MARYNLILRNETFVKAVEISGKQGLSLGKWFNLVIDQAVQRSLSGLEDALLSCFCGRPAVYECHENEGRLFTCEKHFPGKTNVDGYRKVKRVEA